MQGQHWVFIAAGVLYFIVYFYVAPWLRRRRALRELRTLEAVSGQTHRGFAHYLDEDPGQQAQSVMSQAGEQLSTMSRIATESMGTLVTQLLDMNRQQQAQCIELMTIAERCRDREREWRRIAELWREHCANVILQCDGNPSEPLEKLFAEHDRVSSATKADPS